MRDEARLKELFDSYDSYGSVEISEDELYSIVEELVHNKVSAMHIVNVSGAIICIERQKLVPANKKPFDQSCMLWVLID